MNMNRSFFNWLKNLKKFIIAFSFLLVHYNQQTFNINKKNLIANFCKFLAILKTVKFYVFLQIFVRCFLPNFFFFTKW